jgi:hypothetical protein
MRKAISRLCGEFRLGFKESLKMFALAATINGMHWLDNTGSSGTSDEYRFMRTHHA